MACLRRALLAATVALALPAAGPVLAQQRPDADALIERLRQATGDLERARGATAPTGAEALVERLRATRAALGEPAPEPELDEQQVRQLLQERLGGEFGEILAMQVVELAGAPAYAVRIMNPGGNSNDAFMVTTLLVDGATGEVLGRAAGYPSFSEGAPLVRSPTAGESGRELRRRTHR